MFRRALAHAHARSHPFPAHQPNASFTAWPVLGGGACLASLHTSPKHRADRHFRRLQSLSTSINTLRPHCQRARFIIQADYIITIII